MVCISPLGLICAHAGATTSPPSVAARADLAGRRILVTGSRVCDDPDPVFLSLERSLADFGALTVIHGGASGVDAISGEWARQKIFAKLPVRLEVFPANWERYGRRAGPIRNRQMLESGVDLCLAFPGKTSPGTWDCVRQALAMGILVRVCRLK